MRAIAYPTDLSPSSETVFHHALKLALQARCPLDILHVKPEGSPDDWRSFPHVREVLARWGLLDGNITPDEIAARFGVPVRKVEIAHSGGAAEGVYAFVADHKSDLIVMASQGRDGAPRWLAGSVSEAIAQRTRLPTLFVRNGVRPLVVPETGELRLGRVLVPVDTAPAPDTALQSLRYLLQAIGTAPTLDLVHIGDRPPRVDAASAPIRTVSGSSSIVDAIVAEAERTGSDLIAMPTAGHDGFLDALRGSTTERVMRAAHCPLLAMPV